MLRFVCSVAFLSATFVPLSAQWPKALPPGVPRTPDGKPNLSAPAPKTPDGKPDLSGLWQAANGKYLQDLAADGVQVPAQPWAEAFFKKIQANEGKGRPQERCLPHGVTDYDALPMPVKIVQTPGEIVVLYEAYNHFRQVFLDGRPLPKDPQPTWMGYSVGKWEGDTLVVDTIGFQDQGWLDGNKGHPQTDAMHVTERFRRVNFGRLEIQATVDDPKAYTKPFTVKQTLHLLADSEILENICNE